MMLLQLHVRYVRYVIGTTLSGSGHLPSRPYNRGLAPAPHQTPVEDGLVSLTWSGTAAPKVVRKIRFDHFVDPPCSGTDVSRYRGCTLFNGWVVAASQPADFNPSRVTWPRPVGPTISHSPIFCLYVWVRPPWNGHVCTVRKRITVKKKTTKTMTPKKKKKKMLEKRREKEKKEKK